ncbi:MAG: hypothetical protein IJQ54_06895 [Kiritimatiellae bacterium]|nr:hypothetical protein [Kiritimatiellia bacterium]
MDGKSLEEAMERLLTSPKEVEVDGQRVTNQSVGDLIKVANYLASKNALKGKRLPIRITKMAAGGGAV